MELLKIYIEIIRGVVKLYSEFSSQFSLKEWLHAFFCYVPTANAKRIKGGYRTTQKPEPITVNEMFNYLKQSQCKK